MSVAQDRDAHQRRYHWDVEVNLQTAAQEVYHWQRNVHKSLQEYFGSAQESLWSSLLVPWDRANWRPRIRRPSYQILWQNAILGQTTSEEQSWQQSDPHLLGIYLYVGHPWGLLPFQRVQILQTRRKYRAWRQTESDRRLHLAWHW